MVCIFVCCFLYCNLLQLTKVEGLLLPFLYIHTCVIFNKCIQTLLLVGANLFKFGYLFSEEIKTTKNIY